MECTTSRIFLLTIISGNFSAYTTGTGGSILIIGSAAGVAAMGIERIKFYLVPQKNRLAGMLGFFAGAIVLHTSRKDFWRLDQRITHYSLLIAHHSTLTIRIGSYFVFGLLVSQPLKISQSHLSSAVF
jgi:hypothetical protein